MQTLGLSSESRRSDGWLKSIFWPSVDNAWDVDYLGQQGFWICMVVAAIQVVVGALTANVIIFATNVLMAVVFIIGAMGVREAKWPAAATVFAVYFANILAGLAMGSFPGPISILFAAVLLSTLRASYLASEWRPAAEGEDKPTRFNESLRDKLVDQLPPRAWPILQAPFYVLAAMLLLLTLLGIAAIVWRRVEGVGGLLHP